MFGFIVDFLGHVARDFHLHPQDTAGHRSRRTLVRTVLVAAMLGFICISPTVLKGRVPQPRQEKYAPPAAEDFPALPYVKQVEGTMSSADTATCRCNLREDQTVLQTIHRESWRLNPKFPWQAVIHDCQADQDLNFNIMASEMAVCPGKGIFDPSVTAALEKVWQLLQSKTIECDTMGERALRKSIYLIKLLVCFDDALDTVISSLTNYYILTNDTMIGTLASGSFYETMLHMQLLLGNEFLWGFLNSTELPLYEPFRATVNSSHLLLARYNYSEFIALGRQLILVNNPEPSYYWDWEAVNWQERYHTALWFCNASSCKWLGNEGLWEAFWRIFESLGGALELGSILIFILLSTFFYAHAHNDFDQVQGLYNRLRSYFVRACSAFSRQDCNYAPMASCAETSRVPERAEVEVVRKREAESRGMC